MPLDAVTCSSPTDVIVTSAPARLKTSTIHAVSISSQPSAIGTSTFFDIIYSFQKGNKYFFFSDFLPCLFFLLFRNSSAHRKERKGKTLKKKKILHRPACATADRWTTFYNKITKFSE